MSTAPRLENTAVEEMPYDLVELKATIDTLYQRMLFRPANATDAATTYALLKDLTGLGTLTDAWAGVCEALVHHPDFLFTLPPSADTATGAAKDRALLFRSPRAWWGGLRRPLSSMR